MAVMTLSMPIADAAGTARVAGEKGPCDVRAAVPMAASIAELCIRKETVPVGAGLAVPRGPATSTVAVRYTVSLTAALAGSAVTVVVLAVPVFHWVTRL